VIARGGAPAPPQRVCFFGTYAREYTVTQLLLHACRTAGFEVVECHRSLWEQTRHKDTNYFGARSALRLLQQYAANASALARARQRLGPVAMYLVGFNGQLDCLLLRLLVRRRTPVVFAPLVTLTETLVDDRRVFAPGSVRARVAGWLDRASLAAATRVIMDTEAHRRYVIETFGLVPDHVAVWHLGADRNVFYPRPIAPRDGPVRAVFYGSFLRLHGVRTILDAATLLRDRAPEIVLIGEGPEHAASVEYARSRGLTRVHFRSWVPYEALGQIVAEADIGLGVFGTGTKAQMVIPNKVYQMAAAGRPIITADTPAVREVFTHRETVWLCSPGDPAALADAIATLSADPQLRHRLGQQTAALMAQQFEPTAHGVRLGVILAAATRT
jgi:glycosyltransferase involved in cell wall biosynthesis